MTDDKRAELVKFLMENGHGWGTKFMPIKVSRLSPEHRARFMPLSKPDPYYISEYDVLSDAWITRLSPLALKELENGS